MTTDDLYAMAEKHGHSVHCAPLTQNDAFAVEIGDQCHIVLSTRLSQTQEKELLAHELGHCEYAGLYTITSNRSRCEARAKRWAYAAILPLDELKQAIREGDTEVWQIADRFGVSPRFAHDAISYYLTHITILR